MRKSGDATVALAHVSLCVTRGTVQVLLGPNGSGKTTLLKLISTMLLPDSGSILVDGHDTCLHEKEVRKRLGFAVASERSFFPRLTAQENLEFFAVLDEIPRRERRCRVQSVLNTAGLIAQAQHLVMNFSGGMYQRLGIARALLKNPSIILMDEPSRSLDPASAMQLWKLIGELAERGATLLVASHNFQETAAIGQYVAILREGRLCGQRRIGHMSNPEELREFYFDCVGSNDDCDVCLETDSLARALAG